MLVSKNFKDILNGKFDFYESIIDEIKITESENLLVEIATNFEKDYIKLKCSEIWIEVIE